MSIDSEDSALEQALRSDLPTDEAAARMRRRLLAAGVAVGNGMAVTTAAAAGSAPGFIAGTVAKVSALSWGVKVGFAAAVAIPSLGLLAERATEQPAVAAVSAPARPAARAVEAAVPEARAPQRVAPAVEAPQEPSPEPARVGMGALLEVKPRTVEPALDPTRPSQLQFEAGEPASSKAASTLAEETRILDAAFAELANGNEARAAELLREHEARFSNGLLKRERERAKARLNEFYRGN
jgi:hypothetical protein